MRGFVFGAHTTRYLQGLHDTVIDIDEQTATISLQRPVGRFTDGRLHCRH